MTAAHDHGNLHHLADRLSPHQQSGCAYSPPPVPGLPPAAQPEAQGKRAGQRRLPVIGIWEPGRGDLPEQHDEIIRGRLKHPHDTAARALAARHGHRPPRQPPRPLRCPAAIRRRLSAAPPPSSPECAGCQNSDPATSLLFLTPGHHRLVRARQHRQYRPGAHGRTRARLCRSATRPGRRPRHRSRQAPQAHRRGHLGPAPFHGRPPYTQPS